MTKRIGPAGVCLLALALAACRREADRASGSASAPAAPRVSPRVARDVVVVTIDTLRADAVGFIEIFGLPLRVEAARHGAVGARYGAAWSWTEPLLETLPTNVTDPEPAAV